MPHRWYTFRLPTGTLSGGRVYAEKSVRIPVKSATDSDDIGHPRSVATLAV